MAGPGLSNTSSMSDILSAVKNIVLAITTEADDFLSVNGKTNLCAITSPTIVKTTQGRLASVSVIVAGSAQGMIFDGNTLASTANPICPIPAIIGVFKANLPVNFGILVVPGSGQTVSVFFS
jgi:hypothetical protein